MVDKRVFAEPVVVTETEIRIEARVHHAPLGTAFPAPSDDLLGDDWQELQPGDDWPT